MRYLAIDLGDKRTGLALGDRITRLATPLGVLEVPIHERDGESLLEAIHSAIEEHVGGPHASVELVFGLPLNMDDTEGPRAKMVRAFAERVQTRTSRVIRFQDERLTSVEADWTMARSGMTHKEKKQRRDALAAAAILRDFLKALPPEEPTPGSGWRR